MIFLKIFYTTGLIVFLASQSLIAEKYFYSKNKVYGETAETICTTGTSPSDDFCETHMYKLSFFTGSIYGQLALADWRGTTKHSSPTGKCGFRFGGQTYYGKKMLVTHTGIGPSIENDPNPFTACFVFDDVAIEVLKELFNDQRYESLNPKYNAKTQNYSLYSSDRYFWEPYETVAPTVTLDFLKFHLDVSSKRTTFKKKNFGIGRIVLASPLSSFQWFVGLND